MKKILLLSTGGTIASQHGDNGLNPSLGSEDILGYVREVYTHHAFDFEDLLHLDSSEIQPEEWQIIAQRVFDSIHDYDGIIITHGTDTMAYTAAALSYMIQDVNKPVILTGSQLPIENPLTDAKTNIYTAIVAIEHGMTGVMVAFDRKLINGTRAVKVSTMGFDAFDSVNHPYMAKVYADGLRVRQNTTAQEPLTGSPKLYKDVSTDVFLLKIVPGTKPEIFDAIVDLGYRGIVVEAFGAGGMHFIRRDLLDKLSLLSHKGIAVVVCSQCLYERSDLSIYEVGHQIKDKGVISGLDMTTEAAVAKLMWALGQSGNLAQIIALFNTSIAGEITLS